MHYRCIIFLLTVLFTSIIGNVEVIKYHIHVYYLVFIESFVLHLTASENRLCIYTTILVCRLHKNVILILQRLYLYLVLALISVM